MKFSIQLDGKEVKLTEDEDTALRQFEESCAELFTHAPGKEVVLLEDGKIMQSFTQI